MPGHVPTRGRRSRYGALTAIFTAVGLAGTVVACSPSVDDGDAAAGDALRVGSASEALSFSPAGQDAFGLHMVYDYLLDQEDGVYSPRAAESVEYNEGNTVLTITLKEGLTFSDGTPIDADVIKANILWGKDNGAFFSAIEEVVVLDELTVEVRQSVPDHNVLLSLWAMPITTIETTEDPDSFASSPVESGPYLLVEEETTSGATYTFERNPDYWDPEGYPYDDVTITMLPDDTSRLNALKSGQIDVAPIATTTGAEAEQSGFTLNEFSANFDGLILGDRSGEISAPIGDLRVRQAISMAFDREAMVDAVYDGYAIPSSQPYPEGAPGYQDDQADAYTFNPERARQLLAEAGYPDGFQLTMPSYTPMSGRVEPYITQALADIGIDVTFDAQSDDSWLPAYSGGEYAVVPMSLPMVQSIDSASPEFFWNPWGNDDADATDLLDQINAGTPEEAAAATDALGQLQLENAWFAVFAHQSILWASAEGIVVDEPQYADWVRPGDIRPTD